MSEKFDCNGSSDFLSMYTSKSFHSPSYQGHAASEINFTPSPQKPASHGSTHARLNMNGHGQDSIVNGNAFCHEDNVDECVGFLNQELTSIGLPSLYDPTSDTHDTSRLVNNTYDLLQKYGQATRVRDELENRIHRQEADLAHLRESQRNLVRQLDQSQQETVQSQERERQITNKNKTLTAKLKAERDEVKRLQSVIQHRDAQFKHEVKKKERELTKLKDRVHHMLSDKKGNKMGMDISSVVARPSGKRGQWTASIKQEEELYRQVISNFEEKQKELLVENTGLRQCLRDLQREMIKAFRESPPDSNETSPVLKLDEVTADPDEDENSDDGSEEGLEGHFQMPFEYLEENSIKMVKDKCRQLRKYIQLIEKKQAVAEKSPMKSESKHKQAEMEKLKRDVQRYKEIIDEQDQYIQRTMGEGCSEPDAKNFLNESDIAKEKEHLEFQKDLFSEQKSNFEQERKTYNEATLRLHKDKQDFEQEKIKLMQKEFAAMTPFQRRGQGVSVHRHAVKRSLPTTPSIQITRDISQHALRTPECSAPSVATPTTRELYRHLRLISEDDDSDSRPRSADTADPLRGSRTVYAPSPAWANSGRRRPSSAVAKTSPSGDSAWTSHAGHMDNIKMMLFTQQQQSHGQAQKDDDESD